jgi:hypothetical protein
MRVEGGHVDRYDTADFNEDAMVFGGVVQQASKQARNRR